MYKNMLSMFYFDVLIKLKNPMSNQIQPSIACLYQMARKKMNRIIYSLGNKTGKTRVNGITHN